MNTRCHYCGWSFSLSRDALEAAVSAALAANEKTHVEHCPRCRRVIKLPVEQLRRGLPVGWTPTEAEPAEAAEQEPAPEAVAVTEAPQDEPAEAKPRRRRRGAASKAEAEALESAPEPEAEPAQPKRSASKTKSTTGKTAAESS